MKMNKGFTLIELLITIGLLGVVVMLSNNLFIEGTAKFIYLKKNTERLTIKNKVFYEIGKLLKSSDSIVSIDENKITVKKKNAEKSEILPVFYDIDKIVVGDKSIAAQIDNLNFYADAPPPKTRHIIVTLKFGNKLNNYETSWTLRNYEGYKN